MTDPSAKTIRYMEKICFPSEPWSLESIISALERTDTVCKVHFNDKNEPIGYFMAASSFEEAELYRIAVLPAFRGKGEGKRLMEDFLKSCPKETERVFLEVRESNAAAVGLYEKSGFEVIGRRRNYYGNEDGLIYRLTLK